MSLTRLSDEELVSRLHAICREDRLLLARLLLHLIEVDERRLHLTAACPSLFDFCTRRLGMSEGAAFRRITAARLVRRFPSLLERIERGDIHLSTLVLLRDHLTDANFQELVDAASGRKKREVEELLARRAPHPDVPATIRKLPAPAVAAETTPTALPLAASLDPAPAPRAAPRPTPPPARIEPLSEARHKLQLTVSAEVRDKLERARDLMRHRNPSGDLALVVERALDALLATLEKERLAKTTRPERKRRAVAPGHVSRATRREVFERDGEQCTFVNEAGQRCPARAFLELDHVDARALGGSGEAVNVRVRCYAHNLLHAEQVFGRTHVAQRIHFRQRTSDRTAGVPP